MSDPSIRRRLLLYAIALLVLVALGLGLVLGSRSTAFDVVGIVALGAALVGVVAAVFAEIGFSEDRERAASRPDRPENTP